MTVSEPLAENSPLGPPAGALNVTGIPAAALVTGQPSLLLSATCRPVAKALPSIAVCGVPATSVIWFGGLDDGQLDVPVGDVPLSPGDPPVAPAANAEAPISVPARALPKPAATISASPDPASTPEQPRHRCHRRSAHAARGVVHDAPVEHLHLSRQAGGEVVVVGDHEDRRAIGIQLFEEHEERFTGRAVEVSRGLIGQHDRGAAHQRTRDRDALALAAGELARMEVGTIGEPHPGERLGRALTALGDGDAGVQQAFGDVLQGASSAPPERTAERRTRYAWHATWRAHGQRAPPRPGP